METIQLSWQSTIDSRDELSELVDDLGVYSEGEEVDVSDDEDVHLNEGEKNLQEIVANLPKLQRVLLKR